MVRRIAGVMALLVFAVCVIAGIQAQNPFTTVVTNALLAMAFTVVIGLVVGAMAQRMLDENVSAARKTAEKAHVELKDKTDNS